MSSSAAYKARRRARHIAAGLCTKCTAPATRGRHCERHAEMNAFYKRVSDQRRHAAGICENCSKLVAPGDARFCARHRRAFRAYHRDYNRSWNALRRAQAA